MERKEFSYGRVVREAELTQFYILLSGMPEPCTTKRATSLARSIPFRERLSGTTEDFTIISPRIGLQLRESPKRGMVFNDTNSFIKVHGADNYKSMVGIEGDVFVF